MDSCLLCLEFKNDAIKADSKKWKELNIKQILEKHFWPLNSLHNRSFICLTCWQEIDDFHQFYTRIEEVHTKFTEISSFEYYFQEPEILIQQTEFTDLIEEKEPSLKQFKDSNLHTESKQKSERLLEENVIGEDPLEKCKNRKTEKLINTEFFKTNRTHGTESPENTNEAESITIKKEVINSDESSDRLDNGTICETSNFPKSDATVVKSESKNEISNDNHHIKREDYDKFIAEHFKEIACDLCQAPFKNFSTLQKHFTKNHKQRGYIVCCKRKFSNRTGLIDHLLYHLNPDYYKCKECGKSMSERKSFKNHMLRVHRAHEIVRKHSCDICGKAFIKPHVLRDHMLTHLPEDEKKFPCKECGKNYASAHILNQHQQAVHLKRFAKICDICGKSFNSIVELKAHINKHEGIPAPVLTCDICGLRLFSAKGLKLHKANQHPVGGKEDHPCPVCAKVSPNLIALRKHIYRMHGKGYEFKCVICEKAFKRSETLKEHMAAHTGNALYTCQWCPMTFNSNGNMYAHRKRMHRKEWEETQLKKYATDAVELK